MCCDSIGRCGKKEISDQISATSNQRQAPTDRRRRLSANWQGAKSRRAEGRNSGRGLGLNRAKVIWREDQEVPELFGVGSHPMQRVPRIGESDEIPKIHGFAGSSADGRGLRASASCGGYWSWSGV